jgi:hypothetical protein
LGRAALADRCTGALTMEAPRMVVPSMAVPCMRVRCATIVRRRLSMS